MNNLMGFVKAMLPIAAGVAVGMIAVQQYNKMMTEA